MSREYREKDERNDSQDTISGCSNIHAIPTYRMMIQITFWWKNNTSRYRETQNTKTEPKMNGTKDVYHKEIQYSGNASRCSYEARYSSQLAKGWETSTDVLGWHAEPMSYKNGMEFRVRSQCALLRKWILPSKWHKGIHLHLPDLYKSWPWVPELGVMCCWRIQIWLHQEPI